jgi:FMN phosphatase YigB (HAD superfamily)
LVTTGEALRLKALLFDLWGTLIVDPEHRSEPRQQWRAGNVRSVLARAGIELSFERVHAGLSDAGAALSAMHDGGIDVTAAGRVELVLHRLGVEAALPSETLAELEVAICTMHPVHKPQVASGALDLLRATRELGLRTALVSNAGLTTAPNLRSMLEEFGLAPYLDACVFSDELGVAKPDAHIFREALRLVDCEPPQAAFVGDSPHNDIYGARQAGLLTVQIGHRDATPRTGYTENDGARANARITDLGELLTALAEFADLPRTPR